MPSGLEKSARTFGEHVETAAEVDLLGATRYLPATKWNAE